MVNKYLAIISVTAGLMARFRVTKMRSSERSVLVRAIRHERQHDTWVMFRRIYLEVRKAESL